jgi:hypothetical protein
LIFAKALPKLRILWVAASIISSAWFLYWICYDVVVWNKALTQAAPANYVGFTVSLALMILGTQIEKLGIFEKLTRSPKSPKPPKQDIPKVTTKIEEAPEIKQEQPVKEAEPSQPAKEETTEIPPDASIPSGCRFYLGYLHTRPQSVEIPEECLECEHVVECLSPTARRLEHASS